VIIVASVVVKRLLVIRWLKAKNYYNDLDDLYNTGEVPTMLFECLLMCIMPYPNLIGSVYYESANNFTVGIPFYWNDFLTAICIFTRLHFIMRSIVTLSSYTEPRA
jgi:hypothetical protein